MRSTAFVKLASVLTVVILLLSACGDDANSDTLDSDMAAGEILENASDRLADTNTMRFEMSVDGETLIDPSGTMQLLGAEGAMARPNKVDVQFQIKVFGAQTISIKMITIGAESWTTDIVTGNWVTAPDEFGYNPAVLYDNQDGLGPVMGKIYNPQLSGVDEVNGHQTYHVTGTASQGVIRPLTSGTMKGDNIELELWIDGDTWDLARVKVEEPKDSGSDEPATWIMNLSEHNQEIDIVPPV